MLRFYSRKKNYLKKTEKRLHVKLKDHTKPLQRKSDAVELSLDRYQTYSIYTYACMYASMYVLYKPFLMQCFKWQWPTYLPSWNVAKRSSNVVPFVIPFLLATARNAPFSLYIPRSLSAIFNLSLSPLSSSISHFSFFCHFLLLQKHTSECWSHSFNSPNIGWFVKGNNKRKKLCCTLK